MMQKEKLNKKTIAVIAGIIIIGSMVFASNVDVIVTWVVGNFEPSILLEQPPDDSALYTNTTTFEWNASDENPEDVLTNIWYVDLVNTFSSPMLRQINVEENESYDPQPLEDGEWFWRVSVFDGTDTNVSVTWNFTVKVNATNSFPVLSSGQVIPTSGHTATNFIYTVTLSDADNTTPSFIYVNIDGVNHSMSEVDPADNNISDGKDYRYITTLSEGNNHNYSFIVYDGYAINATSIVDNPDVAYVGMAYPVQSNPYPENETYGVDLPLSYFQITISDADGQSMNLTLRTNYSGGWVTFNSSTGLSNGTYNFTNTSWITGFGDMVYWQVVLDDGVYLVNRTYWFMTEALDVVCIYPVNGSLAYPQPYLTFQLISPTGTSMDYIIYIGDAMDNTTTVLGSNTSVPNGTYIHLFALAFDLNETYYWRVYVNDSDMHINETFYFGLTIGGAGILSLGGSFNLVLGLGGWIFGLSALMMVFFIMSKKKKKKRKVVNPNVTYSGRVKHF